MLQLLIFDTSVHPCIHHTRASLFDGDVSTAQMGSMVEICCEVSEHFYRFFCGTFNQIISHALTCSNYLYNTSV